MSHAFMAVILLAIAVGGPKVNELPGCWEYTVGPWRIALNGHSAPRTPSWTSSPVPPFAILLDYNGWPAGILGAHGGLIAAGEGANEATFIAAVEAETRRLGGKLAGEEESDAR